MKIPACVSVLALLALSARADVIYSDCWNPLTEITGTMTPVPEPSPMHLAAVCGVLVVIRHLKKNRKIRINPPYSFRPARPR
jgi:hypothetical protein